MSPSGKQRTPGESCPPERGFFKGLPRNVTQIGPSVRQLIPYLARRSGSPIQPPEPKSGCDGLAGMNKTYAAKWALPMHES